MKINKTLYELGFNPSNEVELDLEGKIVLTIGIFGICIVGFLFVNWFIN